MASTLNDAQTIGPAVGDTLVIYEYRLSADKYRLDPMVPA